MKRRKVIKVSAYSAAALFTAPLTSALLSGCKSDTQMEIAVGGDYSPHYFNQSQFDFIKSLAETLLPETDTVGATSVGVADIIDGVLSQVFTADQKNEYSERIDSLMTFIKDQNEGKSFDALKEESKINYLTKMDAEWRNGNDSISSIYTDLRSRMISTYLGTEEVGTELLNYLPVPGEYQACISLDEAGGKSWTL